MRNRRTIYGSYLAFLMLGVAGMAAISVRGVHTATNATLLALAALAVIADTLLFVGDRDSRQVQLHPSVLPVFAILLEWAWGTAFAAQVLALLVSGLVARRGAAQIVFDIGRYALALFAAEWVLITFGEPAFLLQPGQSLQLVTILTAAFGWFATFHSLTTTEAWLRGAGSWHRISRRTVGREALWAVPLLLLAPLLIGVARIDVWLIILVLAPMYAVTRTVLLLHQQRLSSR